MLSEEKKKRVKEDFARFIRMEAMTMNCFQDDIEETIMSEMELECIEKRIGHRLIKYYKITKNTQ